MTCTFMTYSACIYLMLPHRLATRQCAHYAFPSLTYEPARLFHPVQPLFHGRSVRPPFCRDGPVSALRPGHLSQVGGRAPVTSWGQTRDFMGSNLNILHL